MGALLVPKRQLAGKLCILVDARFYLQRSIYEAGLGEVIDDRRAIMSTVAAPGNPADKVVAVRRSEGQDVDVLHAGLAGQLHQHEVGSNWLRGSLRLVVDTAFGCESPQIFAVVEHLGIGHVIQAIDLSLQLQQLLRVAHMLVQGRWHRGGIFEEIRKHVAVRGENRVFRIKDVKRGRSVVSVDDDLYAVSRVVDGVALERVVARVGRRVGGCEGIDDPGEPAVVPDDDVRVRIECEEGRKRRGASNNVAPHQQTAIWVNVVAKRQLG